MKSILCLLAGMLLVVNVGADDIYSLIELGRLQEAGDSLAVLGSAELRDGNMLFYAALIENDGDKAADLLEASLKSGVSSLHREEVYRRLADYYLLKPDLERLRSLMLEYLTLFENGRFRTEMGRYVLLADEMEGRLDAAGRQAQRQLAGSPKGDARSWAQLDQARVLLRTGDTAAANAVLRSLARHRSAATPVALAVLAAHAATTGDVDATLRYYSLLDESYPAAIGSDAVGDRLDNLTVSPTPTAPPPAPAIGAYTVQVGVFRHLENAQRQKKSFERHGHPVEIVTKSYSGNEMNVVRVGQFTSIEEARSVKKALEREHGEVFQVVPR